MKQLVYAITGANGQIGSFLVDYLRKRGHIVYELVRSPEKTKDRDYYKFFDLTQPWKIPSLQGINVLIHAAYFFNTADKDYEIINIMGTQKLFQQARMDNLKYTIFISTLSAHSAACSLYGRTKYQLEQLLMRENQNIVIIRPGLVFHTPLQGITEAMDNFVKKFPLVPLIGRGKQLIYPCFLEDLAKLIFMISIKQHVTKYPIIAATEQAITFKQLVQYLAKQRHKRVLFLPIPFYGIYCLLKLVEFFRLSIGLKSDNLLGLHYGNMHVDFSETKNVGAHFSSLNISGIDICG